MTAEIFVDTNVLVYGRDASEPKKQEMAMKWMSHLWREKTGRLSYQVLQEYYVTVTQKLDPGLPFDIARMDIRALNSWKPVQIDSSVIEGAWIFQDRFGVSWWDALIVSAAQKADCRYLLSEDFQENQRFGDLQIINPFRSLPENLAN